MFEDLFKNNKPLFFAVIASIILIGIGVTFIRTMSKNTTGLQIMVEAGRRGTGQEDRDDKAEVEDLRHILIHISGAVREPGVYRVPVPFRVIEAVKLAGGFLDSAKTDSINLAEVLKDGQKIDIPFNIVFPPFSQTADGPVNLNTADINKLKTIPGVGESTAKKIIEYRTSKGPFRKIEDLMKVGGIGKGKFERMKGQIKI